MAQSNDAINNTQLIKIILKSKKALIIICLISILISSVFSLLIKDKYESSVILYPTTTSSISKALIAENYGGKDDVLAFGEIEEAEQLIQILNSDEIRDRIIEKFNLIEHYDIDRDDDFKRTKLANCYKSNISFKLTKFLAVEIKVLDYSADTAALIANEISMLLDTVKNRMRHEIAVKAFEIVKNQYGSQKQYVQELEDSLTKLRGYGVIDYESQAERITEQMATAILQGKKVAAKELEDKLAVLSKYGGAYVSIRDQLEYEKKQLTFIHAKYQEAKVDAENNLQHKFIVNKATPAEKATYPIRWLIVVISTLGAILVSLLFIILYNRSKSK
ncbi:MAG: hypothetical protein H6586_03560 [Flavobacteriales bacterium]|nr:hypothetical protein [Flavobacteriales bacterium]